MRYILLTLWLVANNIYAFDLKGISIGDKTTAEAVEEAFYISCKKYPDEPPFCYGDSKLAGQKVFISLSIDKSLLVNSIMVKFKPEDYPAIREAVLNKFGKPVSIKISLVSNAMGASFEQEQLIWQDGKSICSLDKYSGQVSEGMLMISSNEKNIEYQKQYEKNKSDI